MSSLIVALIVFVCVFGCGILGLGLRTLLPDHHLSEDSTVIVKLGACGGQVISDRQIGSFTADFAS